MNINAIRELAGLPSEDDLLEVVQIPDDVSIEDLINRLDHCRKALALANKLPQPDKKRALSMTMVNFNKVRAALQRLLKKEGIDIPVDLNPKLNPQSKQSDQEQSDRERSAQAS